MDATLIAFCGYLVIMLFIGLITYGKNKSHDDFYLAGRKLNPWLVAFSERASGESAWLLLGLPGAVLTIGLVEVWAALGCVIGIIFSWIFIAKKIRIDTEKVNAITLPNYLAKKFGGDDKVIRMTALLIIIFFFIFYLSAQFNGAGKVLNVTFGIDHTYGVLIGAFVIIIYTMLGGFFAVVWTDLVQGIIMIATLVLLPIIAFVELADKGIIVFDAVAEMGKEFSGLTGNKTGWAAAAVIISGLSWGFGYLGQPHLISRYMAINDPEQIKISRRIAIAWAVPAFTGAVLIGIAGIALYGNGMFDDNEKLMPFMAGSLLPQWLAGVLISGAIAAMMSTADSQLLVISSSVLEDLYHSFFRRNITPQKLLIISRVVTFGVGIAALIISLTSSEMIFSMVSYAWGGLGASFGPAILLVLTWKGIKKNGVLAGLITGFVCTVVWSEVSFLNDTLNSRFAAFVISFISIIIVSKLSQGNPSGVQSN